jgi:hypothetical protein
MSTETDSGPSKIAQVAATPATVGGDPRSRDRGLGSAGLRSVAVQATSVRRRRVWLAAGLVAALAVAAALGPATVSAALGKCSYPSLTTPFAPWLDTAQYTLVLGGSFEQKGSAWALAGARILPGNEPFYAHAASDARSLSLPDLSAATSPAICVSEATASIRVFATNDGAPTSSLTVDAGVVGNKGVITWSRLATLVAQAPGWTPSPILSLNLPNSATGTAKVVLRFTAQGGGGTWRIDDVYLDP